MRAGVQMRMSTCVCVCVCFEITGCCLTPCWAGCCFGSFSLTGAPVPEGDEAGTGPVGVSCGIHVVSLVSCRFLSHFQMSRPFLCQLLKS